MRIEVEGHVESPLKPAAAAAAEVEDEAVLKRPLHFSHRANRPRRVLVLSNGRATLLLSKSAAGSGREGRCSCRRHSTRRRALHHRLRLQHLAHLYHLWMNYLMRLLLRMLMEQSQRRQREQPIGLD